MNLLLTKHNELKVSDFGISRMLGDADSYVMTGGIGTLRYMAPEAGSLFRILRKEVVRHGCYDEKVDIYALGLILYFMSSGRTPFHHLGELGARSVCAGFRRGSEPRPLAAECHPALRPLMEAAWHAVPAQRPTARELLEDLGRVPQVKGCGPCAQM
ncbi:STY17 [Symbiodinium natans]|uniref:STY17 protein n=1 Tax=Symbiodinium natans TaxID=878477 RepID=A0A812SXE6_9DINO|nr:STY17 [Symbiodinium natans]